jgi:hypothetical protein
LATNYIAPIHLMADLNKTSLLDKLGRRFHKNLWHNPEKLCACSINN